MTIDKKIDDFSDRAKYAYLRRFDKYEDPFTNIENAGKFITELIEKTNDNGHLGVYMGHSDWMTAKDVVSSQYLRGQESTKIVHAALGVLYGHAFKYGDDKFIQKLMKLW
jgi:hypothetical protein